jgi:hypothetical protein
VKMALGYVGRVQGLLISWNRGRVQPIATGPLAPARSQVELHHCPMRSTDQRGRNQGSVQIMLLTPCRSRTGVSTPSAAVHHYHYCVAQKIPAGRTAAVAAAFAAADAAATRVCVCAQRTGKSPDNKQPSDLLDLCLTV